MELVNKVILDSMVRLVREVPWGPSRDSLMDISKKLSSEGSFEHGWDNYTTAAKLWWDSGIYQLAAEARFPREGDTQVAAMRDSLIRRLVHEISLEADDYDVGETTLKDRTALSRALSPSITDDIIDTLIDELAEADLLDVHPDRLKSWHAEKASDDAKTVQPSAPMRL
jgi:hypothetical protein